MNDDVAKTIFVAGCRLRGSPVLRHLNDLLETDMWSEERLSDLQAERLRFLLVHARKASPFYRRIFEEHGLDCERAAIDDLKRIPTIDKKRLAAERERIQNDGGGGRLLYSKTAGTTSVPLLFYRTASWDAAHRAAIARGLAWHGVDMWARNGCTLSRPPKAVDRARMHVEDLLLNRFRLRRLEASADVFEPFYQKLLGARYLSGYTHVLYEFARYVNDAHPGGALHGLAVVKGTSEKIMPIYQEAARRAFGSSIRSEYGAAEAGIIAFECPEGTMHVNMEHVIVEEEEGEIVVTNLLSHSFPFIRYRLGDYIKLRRGVRCACGRRGFVVDDILGRVGLRIVGKRGEIFPSVSIDFVLKRLVSLGGLVVQCQGVQRKAGLIEFYVVLASGPDGAGPGAAAPGDAVPGDAAPDDAARRAVEKFFAEMMPKFYGDAIDVAVRFVDAIPRTDAKFLEFVSELPSEEQPR